MKGLEASHLVAYSNFQLIVMHINRGYKVRNKYFKKYIYKVKIKVKQIEYYEWSKFQGSKNNS